MMTSLYQAEKSSVRVVRAFESAIGCLRKERRETRDERRCLHRLLRLGSEVLQLNLAFGAVVGADDDREAGAARIGEVELLAERIRVQRELDTDAGIAKF